MDFPIQIKPIRMGSVITYILRGHRVAFPIDGIFLYSYSLSTLMDFPKQVKPIRMGSSITYFKGPQGDFSQL